MFDSVGFGQAPNLGFPGEVSGRLRPWKNWRPIEQATMSYGHGIAVSLMQMARAYTGLRPRWRVDAALADQDRRCAAAWHARVFAANGARTARHAGNGSRPGRYGAQGAGPWLSRWRQDRYRLQGRRRRLCPQIRGVLRRYRADQRAAPGSGGDDRRADQLVATMVAMWPGRPSRRSPAVPCVPWVSRPMHRYRWRKSRRERASYEHAARHPRTPGRPWALCRPAWPTIAARCRQAISSWPTRAPWPTVGVTLAMRWRAGAVAVLWQPGDDFVMVASMGRISSVPALAPAGRSAGAHGLWLPERKRCR